MTTFVPLLTIPMDTLVANLIGAHAFITTYFDSSVAHIIGPQDLIVAVNQTSSYLEWKTWVVAEVEHKDFLWDYDTSFLLPGELNCKNENPSSILHWLLLPSHAISAPTALVVIGSTALVSKAMELEASSSRVSLANTYQDLQVSRESSFTSVAKNTISMSHSGSQTSVGDRDLVPTVSDPTSKRAKLILESDRPAGSSPYSLVPLILIIYLAFPAPPKPASPPLTCVSSFWCKEMTVPVASGKPPCPQHMQKSTPVVSKPPANMTVRAAVDHTIYTCTFHPDIDLQFDKPPFHQALESMKLSMLSVTPESLTKPSA
ncbi:uncharacterized protein BT62DRAFT_920668 [Guyanagaster necrorhizus]|uniref:Uncharacterized protein n=1 Tax=Guyanagaster necrorhizus TaxID=856835 RepID=A0A9P7VQB0_9AGAR|nr:uncharacterized protein BT62DRAFT_920668 [Guyanagaster necrorhizus MCA 3950]KAG7445456.1 hypothetical protein BT62DRAFT_920668 [Guyanagaster necrorhizus MCA 3950]